MNSHTSLLLILLAACDAQLVDPSDVRAPTEDELQAEPAGTSDDGLPERQTSDEDQEAAEPPADTAEPGPPRCAILAPVDGQRADPRDPILFDADAEAVDGSRITLMWSAPSAGMSVLGDSFEYILPPGTHLVTLQVRDAHGSTCADQVEIVVR